MSSAGGTEIQQKQVSGLVDIVVAINSLSGNLTTTGATLTSNILSTGLSVENSLLSTGTTLEAADAVLSGLIDTNTTNLAATGNTLYEDVYSFLGNLLASGQTNAALITASGDYLRGIQDVLTGDIYFNSGRINLVSGYVADVSGWVGVVSGYVDTVSGVGAEVRENLAITGAEISVAVASLASTTRILERWQLYQDRR